MSDTTFKLVTGVLSLTAIVLILDYPSSVTAQGRSPAACGSSAVISGNTITTTSLVEIVAGRKPIICGFVFNGAGATTAKLVKGTGATCGTGTADLTGAMKLIDGSSVTYGGGEGTVIRGAVGDRVCWTNSAGVQVSGVLTYGYER